MIMAAFALACALLAYAGAVKAMEPSAPWRSRALGLGEAVLGTVALLAGGRALATLLAASYAAFAVYVVVALRRGAANCGCFGAAESTPPSRRHVVIDAVLAVGCALAAMTNIAGPVHVALGTPGAGLVYALFLLSATGMTAAALTA